PRSLLQAVFQAWAETDLAAAVEQLDRVGAPSRELLFALTLLGAGDYDRTLLERLAEQSRTLDVAGLEVAAIVEQARRDPVGAVSNVRGLKGRAARQIALEEIARVSVRVDPLAALSGAELVTDWFLRHEYEGALLREWASSDMAGFLQHLATLDSQDPWAANLVRLAFDFVPISDPRSVLESARELGGGLGGIAGSVAVEALAEQDPAGALELVENALPSRKNVLLRAVATGYARSDIDGAVAWVKSLDPPNAAAVAAVVRELASVDLLAAIDLDLTVGSGMAPPDWLILRARSDLDDPA